MSVHDFGDVSSVPSTDLQLYNSLANPITSNLLSKRELSQKEEVSNRVEEVNDKLDEESDHSDEASTHNSEESEREQEEANDNESLYGQDTNEAEEIVVVPRSKTEVLNDLDRLRRNGLHVREFNLNDNVEDMEHEVRRQMMNLEEANAIAFMKNAMQIAFTGIELMNNKMGPFLHLDGWAASTSKDINKYDLPLGKIYRKYMTKKTASSPEAEIAMGIMGSMCMHHFGRKLRVMPGMFGNDGQGRFFDDDEDVPN